MFLLPVACVYWAAGCNPLEEFPAEDITYDTHAGWASSEISGSCVADVNDAPFATRSMIDNVTSKGIEANFLRIDETVGADNTGTYTFGGNGNYQMDWSSAYLLEASVTASPDKDYLRSVYFDPVQTYKINVEKISDGSEQYDTTFYHTRMVGWYPLNCVLPRNESDNAVAVQAGDSRFSGTFFEESVPEDESGSATREGFSVKFTGLDGATDLMFSDVREGQHWHRKGTFPEGDLADGSRYSYPFGHFTQGDALVYSNPFTFRHYLTAVRVWVYADQSPQNISMWGEITGVSFPNQPTSCKISIPDGISAGNPVYGTAYDWDDFKNLDIITDPMYGDDVTSDEGDNLSAEFPVTLEGTSSASMKYVGYAMLRPDNDVTIGIHTTSGVYYVTVESDYKYQDQDGTDKSAEILKAGYIYDIRLNLQTEGTIAALLQNDADLKFFDLSTFSRYSEDNNLAVYRYSNCYVVDPDCEYFTDESGNPMYDGFCFSATVIGNGQTGILPSSGTEVMHTSSATISPVKARLIWESEQGLISQVEFLYGYVRFRVPDQTRHGNAVIGVYDESDKVLWSWHIWMPDSTLEGMAKTVSLPTGNEIILLDRNLGAIESVLNNDTENDLATYGLYYRWGRKHPSMGPKTADYRITSMETADYYDFSSDRKNSAEVKTFAEPSIRDGVENPMYLILSTSRNPYYEFNWLYDDIGFLWGKQEGADGIHKTIYDPCPFGYRVPDSELNAIFDNGTDSRMAHGVRYTVGGTDLYFPYAGYKGVDRGLNSAVYSWRYVGDKGDYQTAKYYEGNESGYYHHRERHYLSEVYSWKEVNVGDYTGYYIPDYTNRRTAASVRCVKDEDIGSITADIYPSSRLLAPDVPFTLTWSVDSYGSSLSVVEVNAMYTVNGNEETRPVWSSADSGESLGYIYQGSRTYTISSADLDLFDDESMRFIVKATNSYGLSAQATCRVARAGIGIDRTAWEQQHEGKKYYVGQTKDLVFRLNGNVANPTFKINGDDVDQDQIEITGSESRGYIYTITYPYTFTRSGTVEFTVDGLYESQSVMVGDRTLSVEVSNNIVLEDLTKITSVSELNDPNAVYIITTSDGDILDGRGGDESDISVSGNINGGSITYSQGFRINSGYTFQSVVATGNYISTTESGGWFSSPNGLEMSGKGDNYSISGNGGDFNIYYVDEGWFDRDYYWYNNNGTLSISEDDARTTFNIYRLNE